MPKTKTSTKPEKKLVNPTPSSKKASSEPQTMEDLLTQTGYKIHGLRRDTQVDGIITSISSGAVFVDIGAKTEGIVAEREYEAARDYIKTLKVGDEIRARVVFPENEAGHAVLSLRGQAQSSAWARILDAKQKGEEITVQIRESVKGGLLANVFGVSGFLPVSQLGSALQKRQEELVDKNLKVKVIEVDEVQGRVIVSEKAVSEKEKLDKIRSVIASIKENEIYEGEITGTMPFGAFVKIKVGQNEVEGLVHVSELSWEKIETLENAYKIGDKVKVKVIGTDEQQSRLSLSIRQLVEDPWKKLVGKYSVDKHISGKVTRLIASGAFVELEPGLDGFLHISKVPVEKKIAPGDVLDCFIEAVEPDKRRISLGLVLTSKPIGYK